MSSANKYAMTSRCHRDGGGWIDAPVLPKGRGPWKLVFVNTMAVYHGQDGSSYETIIWTWEKVSGTAK